MDEGLALFISGIILAATGCILCAGILVFNIKYMKLRFIKMTSPRVNILLVLGGLALYSSCVLLTLPTQTWPLHHQAVILQVVYSVITVSVTLSFSSMLMKGWRVYRLFQYPRVHTVTIRDCSLFAGILIFCILDIVLLVCWFVIDPIKCNTESFPDGNTVLEMQVVCTSQHISAWLLAAILYKYALMFLCCYIGWQIRQITFSALDDGKCLLLGPAIKLTLSGVVSIVMLLFPENTLALRALTSVSVWIGTTTILVTIFFSKMITVFKSSTDEPLMSSASRYVKQPTTDNVGTELVKILGENKYLKQKLEESSSLVNHLKRRVSHTIPPDYDSQQTSSANCSVGTSTISTTLVSDQRSCSSLCCTLFCCMNNSDQSIKGKQGTPVTDRDMSIKTVQVQTTPDIIHQGCYSYTYDVNQCKSVDDYTNSHTVTPVVVTSAITQDCDRVMRAEPQTIDSQSMEAVDFDDVVISQGCCVSGSTMQEDMDLICSIADAYDMGGDSDTFSFISNCLYNAGSNNKSKGHKGSTLSLQRPRKRFSRTSFSQSSTLGSDQLYPDAMSSSKLKSKGHRKYNRRQSLAVTASSANISSLYVNEEGRPVIL